MASRAFAFFFPQGRLGLLLVALLCGLAGGSHESAVLHNVEASWDFEGGLEGWANATAEELDCEVSAMGGEARGTIRGPRPHLDSPIIVVDASDRHYVVIRMRYQGRGTRGLVSVRSGAGAMGDTQSEPWTDSDWRTTCVARHAAACGAVTTLNDGGTACITAAGGGGACTYTAATAGGIVASCRATDEDLCARWAVGDSTSCSALSPACVYATAGGDGGGPFKSVSVPFDVDGDGQYHIHYVPIWEVYKGKVVQLRVFPVLDARSSGGSAADRAGLGAAAGGAGRVGVGDSFSIDWIKVVKAPTIFKVEGCINRYSTSHNLADPALNTSVVVHTAHAHRYSAKWEEDRSIPSGVRRGRTHLFTFQQTIGLQTSPRPYATTYNCLRGGGERVTLTGTNFGVFRPTWTQDTATVTVDGRPCTDVVMTVPQTQLQCNLPPGTRVGAAVRLANGAMPGLYDLKPYVSYAAPPPKLDTPVVANLAASSADLVWKPPSVYWDALAVTGYVVAYRALPEGIDTGTNATAAGAYAAVVLGNVTYTTVVGLKPDTLYEFRVAALSEDQDETGCVESSTAVGAAPGPRCRTDITGMPTAKRTRDQWRQLDLYGRRTLVQGGVVGTYSDAAATVRTLRVDFAFSRFDANATLVHGSEATGLVDVAGPTGSYGGQGHYGLHLVGDAGVENCNSSYACCDSFNATLTTNAKTGKPEAHGCRGASLVCSAIGAVDKHPDYLGGQASRDITTNALADGIFIGGAAILGHNATGQCGGALRLTAAQVSGAIWPPDSGARGCVFCVRACKRLPNTYSQTTRVWLGCRLFPLVFFFFFFLSSSLPLFLFICAHYDIISLGSLARRGTRGGSTCAKALRRRSPSA